jgi:DNA invertase Pin-like site-specific DNA recombinase
LPSSRLTFEADLIRARTREGMKVAKAKGRLRGKQPKLTPRQEEHLVVLHRCGEHTSGELAELFNVARPSLSTSGETLTIEESMTLRARTENVGDVGDEREWSRGCG